ncbi:hypothetical protein QAD02_016841 [Eretmocerus hayati]|uniref:Uncharacterized protein n=1 Tax=Eretmocerus hayati TaxID=131215 RepID=A0ACC2PBQ6_9HYME|nr:hypothetical protein QAD02_016841 [Eretmocerus hayati]
MELTQEQQAFLAECEEEFKDRYTEKDEEFMKIKSMNAVKPPIIDPWYNAPQRSNNRYSRNRDQDRGRDQGRHRGNWHPNLDNSDRYDYRDGRKAKKNRNKKRKKHPKDSNREKSTDRNRSRDKYGSRNRDQFEDRSRDRMSHRNNYREDYRDRDEDRHRNSYRYQYEQRGRNEIERSNNERYRSQERRDQDRQRRIDRDKRYNSRRHYTEEVADEKMEKYLTQDEQTSKFVVKNHKRIPESTILKTDEQTGSKHYSRKELELKHLDECTNTNELRRNEEQESREQDTLMSRVSFHKDSSEVGNINTSKMRRIMTGEDKNFGVCEIQSNISRKTNVCEEIEHTKSKIGETNSDNYNDTQSSMKNPEKIVTETKSCGMRDQDGIKEITRNISLLEKAKANEETKLKIHENTLIALSNDSHIITKRVGVETGEYEGVIHKENNKHAMIDVDRLEMNEVDQDGLMVDKTISTSEDERSCGIGKKNSEKNNCHIIDSMNNNFIRLGNQAKFENLNQLKCNHESTNIQKHYNENVWSTRSNDLDSNEIQELVNNREIDDEILITQVINSKDENEIGSSDKYNSTIIDCEETNIVKEITYIDLEELNQVAYENEYTSQENHDWQMMIDVGCEVEIEDPSQSVEDEVSLIMKSLQECQN